MTTIIINQPLATLIVYGKIQEVPEDINDKLLKEENVLVAAGLKSFKNNQELDDILNKYGVSDIEDLPDLRFVPQVSFLGFARVEDGKFVYAKPMPAIVTIPSYLHISDKVVDYPISDYKIVQFLEDNRYIHEDELKQLIKQRERIASNNPNLLQDLDKKIADKRQRISEILEKENNSLNETKNEDENSESEDEKSKMKWWHIILLAIAFGLLCWFIEKISFLIIVAVFFIGQVFIWLTGGKGGLKM